MPWSPVVFTSKLRVAFADLDPFHHVGTAVYARYFVDHRTNGLRDFVGWDLKTLAQLPFMTWVRRMEIDFVKSAVGDQELTLSSFVREFRGSDAYIECTMADETGRVLFPVPDDRRLRRQAHPQADGLARGGREPLLRGSVSRRRPEQVPKRCQPIHRVYDGSLADSAGAR